MRSFYSLLFLVLGGLALEERPFFNQFGHARRYEKGNPFNNPGPYPKTQKRSDATSTSRASFLTNSTLSFAVNGTNIPNVTFDVGESYAGLLPISSKPNEHSKLWFWFFPTTNPAAGDEILIWLNGGPGCSSLLGFITENGPFLWQPGTLVPDQNPWSWTNLTNVIWIDQPVGTGFSEGTPSITSEEELAAQFLGFWKNFNTLFDLQGWDIYIAGESYAGRYVPYIADAMFSSNDTVNYNVQGTMLNDALIGVNSLQEEVAAVPFVKYWNNLFQLNSTFMDYIQTTADSCNYTSFMDEYLVFPAATDLTAKTYGSCAFLEAEIQAALTLKNPCFDLFHITNTCPLLWDVIPPPAYPGYPVYQSQGPGTTFFNTDSVKLAINAPVNKTWEECTSKNVFVKGIDKSPAPNTAVYPRIIEKSVRTVLAHGSLDMILLTNGTLLTIQTMEWNGATGFTTEPSDLFVVPATPGINVINQAGSGIYGITHTERNLTWVQVDWAGHMIPQYAPAAAYRYLEFLLGRIDSLSS